jgi:hypothetical protein
MIITKYKNGRKISKSTADKFNKNKKNTSRAIPTSTRSTKKVNTQTKSVPCKKKSPAQKKKKRGCGCGR